MNVISTLYNAVRGGVAFKPATDIPPLNDKVILVTGGNAGLGKAAIQQLAAHSPARIYLASRDASRAQSAIADITRAVPSAGSVIKPLSLDLTSFASIKAAAQQVLSECSRLDILMLNAGIMATPAATTQEGYEIQFGTNHVGHALLTKLLLPLLLRTAALQLQQSPETRKPDVRVVVLSSMAHLFSAPGGIDFSTLKGAGSGGLYWTWALYGQSKLANILFAKELARRYPQLTVVAVHPGVVNTNLMIPFSQQYLVAHLARRAGGWVLSTADQAVRNQLWAAAATKGIENGEFYYPVGVAGLAGGRANDGELARMLWEWTEKELEGQVLGSLIN
ncbi:Short-chain dehydrogenase TIC 32, chloroplastic [Madurella mycetomatis]|uniref:Short-chain dehydrogenase TIC 32, chloroplastic n=1 Tax=Madurella mycetomatis TaxID=100816 RepID=A0A175VS19_9PEZI|nr:Short-chain dehydrogenase TIC 32, chloroplastic [Madurella mycetomatis]